MKLSGLVLVSCATLASSGSPTFEYSSHSTKPTEDEHQWRAREPYRQPVQHAQLFPAVHPSVNKRDHAHFKRSSTASLWYTETGDKPLIDSQMVAILDTQFHWDTVILDHSDHIQEVECTASNMIITFNSPEALQSAHAHWADEHIVFGSSAPSCHVQYPGQFGFFNATSVAFNTWALLATVKGELITMEDAVSEYEIEWGEYQTSTDGSQANVRRAAVSARTSSTTSRTSTSTTTSKSTISTRKSSSTSRTTSTRTTSSTSKTSSKPSSTTSKFTSSSKVSSKSSTTSKTTSKSGTSTSTTAARLLPALASQPSTTRTSTSSSTTDSGFQAMTRSSTTGKCGVMPTPRPEAYKHFSGASCDDKFDKTIDDFLAYIKDSSSFDSVVAAFAPGVEGISMQDYNGGTHKVRSAKVRKRDLHSRFNPFGWVNDNIIKPVSKAINTVVTTVTNAIVFVAKTLDKAAQDAVNWVREQAEAFLPNFSPSVSFTIPISCQAPSWMLEESPWGDAYKLWEWKKGQGEFNYGINAASLAKMVGADQLITFKVKGVEQLPQPGIQAYCVNCNIKGSMKTTGSATFTLLVGFTKLSMRMEGNINALVQLGLNAYAEYKKDLFRLRILEAGVPGFWIPGVIIVGPMLTLDVDAVLEIDALGQMLAGARLKFDHIGAYIDFFDHHKSTAHGFIPQISPVFNVSGVLTAKASIGAPVGVGIGVDILSGKYTKRVAVVDRPAVQALASYSGSAVFGGTKKFKAREDEKHLQTREKSEMQENCKGIYYSSGLVNDITLNIFDDWKYAIGNWEGLRFLEGCIGDNGVKMVKEQQQPNSPGKTRGGCALSNDLIRNPGFDDMNGNVADAWFYTIDPNLGVNNPKSIQVNIFEDSKTSSPPRNVGFWIENADNAVTYTANIFQTVTACTYSPYDITFQARLLKNDGICKVTAAYAKSNNAALNVVVPVDQIIFPVTAGKDFMQGFGPYTVSFLGQNNANSVAVNFGITVVCQHASKFDLRIDDVSVVPNPAAYAKRDRIDMITPRSDGNDTDLIPDLSNSHPVMFVGAVDGTAMNLENSTSTSLVKRGDSSPDTLPKGNAFPSIDGANKAPPIATKPATVLPGVQGANSAPGVEPNHQAPSMTNVPVVYSGSQPAYVDPTATAVKIGPADYEFPAWSKMMASATLGVIGAAPTDSINSNEPFTGWSQLSDLTGKLQIASSGDGNIYLTGYPGSGPGTSWYSEDSVVVTDYNQRLFHYHPDTMKLYGVSRLRLATIGDSPLTSQLITLVPFTTSSGTVYGAVDTQGNAFVLAACTAPQWLGSKVFLTKDYDDSLKKLLSGEVQWIVTGNNVTQCNPLLLTSGAKPLVLTNE